MKISEMNWSQVEAYLKHDDRAVLPLGSTEQHAYLSLCVDCILPERVALEASESLGVPVFPPINYGVTPYFMGFPGTITLKPETLQNVMGDLLDSLMAHGFRRVVIVNGHGGNRPAHAMSSAWMKSHPEMKVKFHNWWKAPNTWKKVKAIDPVASHASWMENFPWTRLHNAAMPEVQKPMLDIARIHSFNPAGVRDYIGDGNFGGYYQRSDDDMMAIWEVAVAETRDVIECDW
jgi:creatinine amidohydrolase